MKTRPLKAVLMMTLVTLLPLQAIGGADAPLPLAVAEAVADSDGEGYAAVYIPNNTAATAQAIAATPALVTGAVNQPGSGPPGWSHNAGDVVDVYHVALQAGQRITLTMTGDGVRDDLDLGLADTRGRLLDAAIGQGQVETLTVIEEGEALVLVGASQGAARYQLTIGPAQETLPPSMRLREPFVVGEAITRFHDDPVPGTDSLRVQAQARGAFAGREWEGGQRNTLLKLEGLAVGAGAGRAPAGVEAAAFPGGFQPVDAGSQAKLATLYRIKALNLEPDVRWAAPNYIRRAAFTPNDTYFGYQWHLRLLNLPQAWDLTTGANVIVAVLDTGVVTSHPDLQGQLVAGYDFISNASNANDGDGIDPNPDDPGDHAKSDGSSSFHGTHVAGTVAAATNNALGVAGVAFNAKIMPLRVLGRDGGTDYDIEQAVRFAAGLANDSGTLPARRADVMNLSLGGPGFLPGSQEIYDQAYAAGVAIVAAAGNAGSSEANYPAAFGSVIAVGAVDITKARAFYSNFGSWIDVVGPGGNLNQDTNGDSWPDAILSTASTDLGGALVSDYAMNQGTSMAAPYVAGVLALMKSAAPGLTPQRIKEVLLVNGALTDDLGAAGKDAQFGYGLINAQKAVTAAGGTPATGTYQTIDPARLNFGIKVGTMAPNP